MASLWYVIQKIKMLYKMANTYTQFYFHLVFAVKNLDTLIKKEWKDEVEEIKTSSNAWIREKRLSKFKFEWQKGYGAFTHSRSQIDTVVKYILTQEEHHKRRSFKDEYLEIMERNDIAFNQEYLFEFFNDIYEWD
jgi:putative transposase